MNQPVPIRTRIWLEEAEPSNPFATAAARCHGFDVYGEMLGRAGWSDMLYLLLRGEPPNPAQRETMEALAVILANPGPRDPSVHAAMCSGVGGSAAAASLIAALAVGAGQYSGAREVWLAMRAWYVCGTEVDSWRDYLSRPLTDPGPAWPAPEHPPGFDPLGSETATPVRQSLTHLAQLGAGPHVAWLLANREALESVAGRPLALTGVVATAFLDLGFTARQGEMLHLLLRLPGAAAHALEQADYGFKEFPFYSLELEDEAK